jgi:hypothetical protein
MPIPERRNAVNIVKQRQRVQRESESDAGQSQGQRSQTQDWSQFWPRTETTSQTATETVIQEMLTDFDRRGAVQDRLAGYRSESQGE